jgi:hypothetical protein
VIDDVIARWHRYLGGQLPGGLDQLLSDDVVFFSPVVYTPQRGKRLAMQYLEAASRALAGEVAAMERGSRVVMRPRRPCVGGSKRSPTAPEPTYTERRSSAAATCLTERRHPAPVGAGCVG